VTIKLQAEGLPWQPNVLGLPEIDDEAEEACVAFLRDGAAATNERATAVISQLRALPALACLFADG
jgi:hypothetical protein